MARENKTMANAGTGDYHPFSSAASIYLPSSSSQSLTPADKIATFMGLIGDASLRA